MPPLFPFVSATLAIAFQAFSSGAAAEPRVIATIKPIHSLTASILDGVAEPRLLLDGAASPHAYALKPSDVKALTEADAVIRVSENLETFLDRAIGVLPAKTRIIDLEKTPGLTLLPVRTAAGSAQTQAAEQAAFDVHFWLDPVNAIAIAHYLDRSFSEIDPGHAAQYHRNAGRLERRLTVLDASLKDKLAGLSGRPFLVFHDVTQYLEKRYGLGGLGAITLTPEREPGARQLRSVRAQIEKDRVRCVFSEPEFPPKLVTMLTAGTRAKQSVLDEVGAAFPAGRDQYFALLNWDAGNLASCLKSAE